MERPAACGCVVECAACCDYDQPVRVDGAPHPVSAQVGVAGQAVATDDVVEGGAHFDAVVLDLRTVGRVGSLVTIWHFGHVLGVNLFVNCKCRLFFLL